MTSSTHPTTCPCLPCQNKRFPVPLESGVFHDAQGEGPTTASYLRDRITRENRDLVTTTGDSGSNRHSTELQEGTAQSDERVPVGVQIVISPLQSDGAYVKELAEIDRDAAQLLEVKR